MHERRVLPARRGSLAAVAAAEHICRLGLGAAGWACVLGGQVLPRAHVAEVVAAGEQRHVAPGERLVADRAWRHQRLLVPKATVIAAAGLLMRWPSSGCRRAAAASARGRGHGGLHHSASAIYGRWSGLKLGPAAVRGAAAVHGGWSCHRLGICRRHSSGP